MDMHDCGRPPMLLSPAFKDYIWGGDRLVKEYGKKTDMRPVAESWELSCHPDGYSHIASGAYKGRTLAGVLGERPDWVATGAAARAYSGFPILIKLIDAKRDLSLQVHPNDDYAKKYENDNGKNEAWYVIDCEPGSSLILGLGENMPEGGVSALLKDESILKYVRDVPVKPGDCFCVPAGLLHAIRGGVLIAEVQQSSNVTYRVFDYGRTGPDGRPRQLHTNHAARVIDASARAGNAAENAVTRQFDGYRAADLIDWPYFKLSRIDVNGVARLLCGDTFQALLVVDGELAVESEVSLAAEKGACVFIPAGLGRYALRGRGQALITTI